MKTKLLFLLFVFSIFTNLSNAQDVPRVTFDTSKQEFETFEDAKNKIQIKKSRKSEDQIISFTIIQSEFKWLDKDDKDEKEEKDKYSYTIDVVKDKTNLIESAYKLHTSPVEITRDEKKQQFFLEIKGDEVWDRERTIYLKITIKKGEDELKKVPEDVKNELEIILEPATTPLDDYEYLAYVGTNFDLVEGIRAQDLFFAGNILSKPDRSNKKSVGFYLSLYGNRAFTQIDSTGFTRNSETYTPLTDSTYVLTTNEDQFLTKRVTDNIGAYISPLIQLKWFKTRDPNNNLMLYYSPSLEFVYRRTTLSFEKIGTRPIESTTIEGDFNLVQNLNTEFPNFAEVFNEYSFNAGLIALFMCLENDKISVRVHGSVGYTSNYFREFDSNGVNSETEQKSDIFFSGRAWITEPTTGITLQAEVTNTMINPRPFFVATLSKAFNFSNLGSIFQPVVKK